MLQSGIAFVSIDFVVLKSLLVVAFSFRLVYVVVVTMDSVLVQSILVDFESYVR